VSWLLIYSIVDKFIFLGIKADKKGTYGSKDGIFGSFTVFSVSVGWVIFLACLPSILFNNSVMLGEIGWEFFRYISIVPLTTFLYNFLPLVAPTTTEYLYDTFSYSIDYCKELFERLTPDFLQKSLKHYLPESILDFFGVKKRQNEVDANQPYVFTNVWMPLIIVICFVPLLVAFLYKIAPSKLAKRKLN
jgi:hypothetical protein